MLQKYKSEGHDLVIIAGAEYGSGSSRDSAAKGPMLLVRSSCERTRFKSLNGEDLRTIFRKTTFKNNVSIYVTSIYRASSL
jgi:hypothetical protein